MSLATTPQLPFMLSAPARAQKLQDMSKPAQIRVGAEVLMRTLNAIAAGDDAGGVSRYITSDARFRTALSLAIPLSLSGCTKRRQPFIAIATKAARLAKEAGVTGAAGAALEASRRLAHAVLDTAEDVADYVEQAIALSVDAEILAGAVRGQNPRQTRAQAEARILDVCNHASADRHHPLRRTA